MREFFMSMAMTFLIGTAFSQQTIEFRDGQKLKIEGEKLGNNITYDFFDPALQEKMIEYYWKESNGIVTIFEYITWLTVNNKGRMDELRIYKISISQQDRNPTVAEELDDNEKIVNYSMRFKFLDETPVKVEVYDIYNSNPKQVKEIGYLDIYSLEKSGFEILAEKMKLPETNGEEISE